MKSLPFFFVLVLTFAWWYTSWYWYTCNIKGFCNETSQNTTLWEVQSDEEVSETIDDTFTVPSSNIPRLSANDVLIENPSIQNQTPQNTENTATGASATGSENLIKESEISAGTWETMQELSLCDESFVWPIAVGGKNDTKQVQILESFLLSQWTSVSIDGVYDASDIEAVKEFQLEYKEDILDPWGIAAPTWYVFTTTIKKMKEIACQ